MPPHRKLYAIIACACPPLAWAYVRVRFHKQRKKLVFK